MASRSSSFNPTQLAAAAAIVQAFAVTHRTAATDQHQNAAALAVFAVLSGDLAAVPGPYKHLLADVELSRADPATISERIAALTAPVQSIASTADELASQIETAASDRVAEIFEGTTRDEDGSLFISQHFADMLQVEVGKWVPFSVMAAGVEKAMAAATTEAENASPQFDSMTVAELNAFAASNNVDLQGVTKKTDIIKVLKEFHLG
jgi:hypothetical protein